MTLRPQGERQERRQTSPPARTLWYSWDLTVKDEPLLWALIKYRQADNRTLFGNLPTSWKARRELFSNALKPNLISSLTEDGKQAPILDLDYLHGYYASHVPNRGYIYFHYMTYRARLRVQRALYRAGLSTTKVAIGNTCIDVPHRYIESTHSGHAHLYFDVEISKWQWTRLMVSLYRAGIIELGYFVWSLRRGANFVRLPGVDKQRNAESGHYTYGWLFKLKDKT